MISLRISEEEYEVLKGAYATHGVRSLSEFARVAMHRVLGSPELSGNNLESRVRVLDGKVSQLEGELSKLSRVVEEELQPGRKCESL